MTFKRGDLVKLCMPVCLLQEPSWFETYKDKIGEVQLHPTDCADYIEIVWWPELHIYDKFHREWLKHFGEK